MGCKDCPLYWDISTLQTMASKYRTKKECWLIKVIRDIKYKIWFKRNWK
jgi:hypothetical protein